MKLSNIKLIIQAIKSCKNQHDLSIDSVKRYYTCFRFMEYCGEVCGKINIKHIKFMSIISPKNSNNLRLAPAYFKNGNFAVNSEFIEDQLEKLCTAYNEGHLSAKQFFIEFEKIHPYNDGNGRVGEIIYWWMAGNFNCPHSYFSNY